jgi:isocitrate dehydrogenase
MVAAPCSQACSQQCAWLCTPHKSTFMQQTKTPITIAYGDGIGPEIMTATRRILDAANAPLEYEVIEIGEQVYLQGVSAGIKPEAWESLRRTKVFLKSPITTPQGGGFKSLNVTTRKMLGLYANVRPCVSYHPFISTKHPVMDMVIVRENEEDLYAGIEHQQTDEVVQCLKIISRPGTEKIIRYAFEYAKAYGRKKVTCFSKDNIMKMTDGLFHKMFDTVGAEYPGIEKEHYIVDIGAARLADTPERFDVVVMPNLYGDIISDIAAQITGSVGLGGSANIGETVAMFEAIHGSAPDIAGQDIANPSGLLLGAVQMLVHLGMGDVAQRIQNAWLCTLEDGIHTKDIYKESNSKILAGTAAFTNAVIERLGRQPKQLKPVDYSKSGQGFNVFVTPHPPAKKTLVGVDIFLHHNHRDPNALGEALKNFKAGNMHLTMITNRGVKVWPEGFSETFCTDHWRCRFKHEELLPSHYTDVLQLMTDIHRAGFDIIKTENLVTLDGVPMFTAGQGQ